MSRIRIRVQCVFVAGLLFLRTSRTIFQVPDMDRSGAEQSAMDWLQAVRYTDLCNNGWYRFSERVRRQAATNCARAADLWRILPPSKRVSCEAEGARCVRRPLALGLATGYCAFRCACGTSTAEKALRELVDPVPVLVNKIRARRFAKAAAAKPKRGKPQRIKVDESIYPSSP